MEKKFKILLGLIAMNSKDSYCQDMVRLLVLKEDQRKSRKQDK